MHHVVVGNKLLELEKQAYQTSFLSFPTLDGQMGTQPPPPPPTTTHTLGDVKHLGGWLLSLAAQLGDYH